MDKHAAGLAILARALVHVPFDGWTARSLAQGAAGAGYSEIDLLRVFPASVSDALKLFASDSDTRMLEAYKNLSPAPAKIRERIASLVRLRLEVNAPHREAIRRALAYYALPLHAAAGMAALAHTVDAMWHAAGDTSTDFNWYSKRALLSGVYSSTLLYWLNDQSEGHADTWAFLDRRIGDVMKIEGWKSKLRELVNTK